jgi:hypothetical protein
MPEVIRRVIIEVETRQKKSRLESPDAGAAERAYKAETEGREAAIKATERHAQVSRQARLSMVNDFREAGEGALRFSRGLALLSASGSDDLKKLVQHVAIAQGAFDVFAGGTKAITSLTAALGPLGTAIGGVGLALGATVAGWRLYATGVADARKSAEQMRQETDALNRSLQAQSAYHAEVTRGLSAVRGIELQIAEAGGLTGLRAHETRLRRAFEREQEPAFRHSEESIRLGRILPPRQLQGALFTEEKQMELLRERLDVSRRIHEIEQRDLLARQSAQSAVGGLLAGLAPGFAPAINVGVQAPLAEERTQFLSEYRKFMQDLLHAMLDQQHLLNQMRLQLNQTNPR